MFEPAHRRRTAGFRFFATDAIVIGVLAAAAMINTLECGGDTDTAGAILGALVGATLGKQGIPSDWLAGICDWPRSVSFMERVAARLGEQKHSENSTGSVPCFWPGIIPRNVLFLAVVLLHGFRRLAPPY